MSESKLINVYGARISKSGKHVNLTLVEGEGENKQFLTACIKRDTSSKICATIKEGYAYIRVPLLEGKEKPFDAIDDTDELNDEDLPF